MGPKCPRSRIKSLVRKRIPQSKLKARKTDIIIWLHYMMFLQRLAKRAEDQAKEEKSKIITGLHVRSVIKDVLRSCKG